MPAIENWMEICLFFNVKLHKSLKKQIAKISQLLLASQTMLQLPRKWLTRNNFMVRENKLHKLLKTIAEMIEVWQKKNILTCQVLFAHF